MMETPLINPTSIGRLLFQDVFVGTPKWFRVRRLNCTNLAIWRAMPSEAIHQEIVDELGGCHNGGITAAGVGMPQPKKAGNFRQLGNRGAGQREQIPERSDRGREGHRLTFTLRAKRSLISYFRW